MELYPARVKRKRKRRSMFDGMSEEEISAIKRKKYRERYRKNISYSKEYYKKNKERMLKNKKIRLSKEEYRLKRNATELRYYHKNKEKISEKIKADKKINPQKYKKYRDNLKNNQINNFNNRLRGRIHKFFKIHGIKKKTSTSDLLGSDFQTVKKHIERQFKKGMTWENRGKIWHIDHIIPLSSGKTEQERILLCHYTNLQPLFAKENLLKRAKIPKVQMKLPI